MHIDTYNSISSHISTFLHKHYSLLHTDNFTIYKTSVPISFLSHNSPITGYYHCYVWGASRLREFIHSAFDSFPHSFPLHYLDFSIIKKKHCPHNKKSECTLVHLSKWSLTSIFHKFTQLTKLLELLVILT